jgi:hypothetical protein
LIKKMAATKLRKTGNQPARFGAAAGQTPQEDPAAANIATD